MKTALSCSEVNCSRRLLGGYLELPEDCFVVAWRLLGYLEDVQGIAWRLLALNVYVL